MHPMKKPKTNNKSNGILLDYVQARKFWRACMESKRAEAMASFLGLPTELLQVGEPYSNVQMREDVADQHRTLASFFRALASLMDGHSAPD